MLQRTATQRLAIALGDQPFELCSCSSCLIRLLNSWCDFSKVLWHPRNQPPHACNIDRSRVFVFIIRSLKTPDFVVAVYEIVVTSVKPLTKEVPR